MRFQANTEQGPLPVVITKIEEEMITADGNHPLAGQTLNFSVTVDEVREASAEELSHGHVHSGGGCCGGGGGEDSGGGCGCS